MIDNRRIADEAAKAEIKDFYAGPGSPPPVTTPQTDIGASVGSPLKPHPERIAPLRPWQGSAAAAHSGLGDKGRGMINYLRFNF